MRRTGRGAAPRSRAAALLAAAALLCSLTHGATGAHANTSRAYFAERTAACEIAPGFRTDCAHTSTCDCMSACEALDVLGLPGEALLCYNHSRTASSTLEDVLRAPLLFYGRTRVVQEGGNSVAEVPSDQAWQQALLLGPSDQPLHPRECADSCSMHGWCKGDAKPARCQCFVGWQGATCDTRAPPQPCLNACTERGECVDGVCACAPGRHGVDCSLPLDPAADAAATGVRPRIYIYELPPAFNVWREMVAINRNPSYLLWERLLVSPYRTARAADADFFLLPVGAMGSVSHGVPLQAAEHVRMTWPYWNASRGRDHLIVWPWDFGSCWVARHPSVASAIHVGHYGLTAVRANDGQCSCPLCGPAFVPGKDIVVPSTLEFDTILRSPFGTAAAATERTQLLFFSGAPTGPERSQLLKVGVAARPDVLITSEFVSLGDNMLKSVFCIGAPGAGYGTRAVLAVLMGCIPVTFGDNMEQPWAEQLDWGAFSVHVREAHVSRIVDIVAAIPAAEVRRLQAALACVWRFFSWSSLWGALAGEDGSSDAFEMLMWALRERAMHGMQRRKLHPCEAVPDGRGSPRSLCKAGTCPDGLAPGWPHGGAAAAAG